MLLLMGFESRTSDAGSNRSAGCALATALLKMKICWIM